MLKKLSYIGYSAALATGPALLTACSSTTAEQAPDPSVLFSLTTDSIHFENVKGTTSTLVMEGVDPHTVWFTDRPARESGAISTMRLAEGWQPGGTFADVPPNAALVVHQATKADGAVAETLVAEITAVGYDPANKTFRADLRVLSAPEAATLEGHLAAHGDRHDLVWPSSAGAASLFIDSVDLSSVQASDAPPPAPASSSAPAAASSSAPAAAAPTTPSPSPMASSSSRPSLTPSASNSPVPVVVVSATRNGRVITRTETPAPPPPPPSSRPSASPLPCMVAGNCTVATQEPVITLCSSPSTCNSSGSQNYTYNSTIYFTASISDNR